MLLMGLCTVGCRLGIIKCLRRKWRNNSDRELFLWDHIARLWQLQLGHAVGRTLMQYLLGGKYLWL